MGQRGDGSASERASDAGREGPQSPGRDSLATADLVLAAVALPMVLATLLWAVFSVQLGLALGAGSVPATGTIGYALFYDPPAGG